MKEKHILMFTKNSANRLITVYNILIIFGLVHGIAAALEV